MVTRRISFLQVALASLLTLGLGSGPAQAEDSPKAEWITLGTSGGPPLQIARAPIANALVVNGAVYFFDMGNGAQRQMVLAGLHENDLKAVFLTHHHIDHNASLGPVLVMHWTMGRGVLPVFGPLGTVHMAASLAATFKATDLPEALQEPTPVYADANIKVSAIGVDHFQVPPSTPMDHMPDAVAYRVEAGGRIFVFTGDTGPSARLLKLAKGADVLISEVVEPGAVRAFLARSMGDATPAMRDAVAHSMTSNHLTPLQIGELAHAAGVKSVVLTHFVPVPEQTQDPEAFVRDIRSKFCGPVTMAKDLQHF